MQLRTYKYRIYPSSKQKVRLINNFKACKSAYNELLALKKDAYKFGKVSISKYDSDAFLKNKFTDIHSQVKQNVSDRNDKAFKNFFRRVKDPKEKQKGFPRFKSRVNSITFPQSGFKLLSDKRLKLSKIGSVPIVLHRVPKGIIKTLTIKVNKANQWFVFFSCEQTDIILKHPSKEEIGIDVGLENFATFSNKEVIENPRFLIKSERKLAKFQRRFSKKKKGSVNRRKAKHVLAKQHLKVANQREDFLHKLSRTLTLNYSKIAVEKLNIKNMLKNHNLARSISDASWNTFIQFLSYKAVTCGGQVIQVDARNTSKKCSNCGTIAEMPLSKRKFLCPNCGLSLHRDLNASINIQSRAGLVQTYTPVDDYVRPSFEKAIVCEAGTINNNS